jgi:hypothetical protein
MEQDLRSMLTERAEGVRMDTARRGETLRTARWRRGLGAATSVLGVAAVVVIGVGIADWSQSEPPRPAPVDRPSEDDGDDEDGKRARHVLPPAVPKTDVLIAEARDGSWYMFAGVTDDGETLCLSLEGVGCTVAKLEEGFVVLTSYGGVEQRGFLYGPVHRSVATLELVTNEDVIPLLLQEFPDRLGLQQLRFYVRPLRGQGEGTIIARDAEGNVLQRMETSWGEA